jgi:hypothetical protein
MLILLPSILPWIDNYEHEDCSQHHHRHIHNKQRERKERKKRLTVKRVALLNEQTEKEELMLRPVNDSLTNVEMCFLPPHTVILLLFNTNNTLFLLFSENFSNIESIIKIAHYGACFYFKLQTSSSSSSTVYAEDGEKRSVLRK